MKARILFMFYTLALLSITTLAKDGSMNTTIKPTKSKKKNLGKLESQLRKLATLLAQENDDQQSNTLPSNMNMPNMFQMPFMVPQAFPGFNQPSQHSNKAHHESNKNANRSMHDQQDNKKHAKYPHHFDPLAYSMMMGMYNPYMWAVHHPYMFGGAHPMAHNMFMYPYMMGMNPMMSMMAMNPFMMMNPYSMMMAMSGMYSSVNHGMYGMPNQQNIAKNDEKQKEEQQDVQDAGEEPQDIPGNEQEPQFDSVDEQVEENPKKSREEKRFRALGKNKINEYYNPEEMALALDDSIDFKSTNFIQQLNKLENEAIQQAKEAKQAGNKI